MVKFVGVIGSGIDITKLKLAHTELLLNEQHFSNEMSNIFNFLPEGIIVLNKEFKLLRNNSAF
jgi:PAS domain-containing protein